MAEDDSAKIETTWKLWEGNGRREFMKHIKSNAKNYANSSPLFWKSEKLIFRAIYDLLALGIRGKIKKELVVSTLNDISAVNVDFPSIILDIVGIFDAETSSDGQADQRKVFCQIVREFEKSYSDKLLKERLEIDTLQDVGTIKNNTFYTKLIKVKTKLYYKQRRFNLFREESEGYAKLITELNQDDHVSAKKTLEIIKSLIGCFNLDPNRVLDIILESFETRPEQHSMYIALLKVYMPKSNVICEVLGYKYRYFSGRKTPRSLYIITALLLQSGIIALDDIYSWLSPNDKTLIGEWAADLEEAKEYVRKLNIVSTNKDKEPEPEIERDDSEEKYLINQKWNLCEALLFVGDWATAQKVLDKLPRQSVLVNEPVSQALCDLIHRIIEPVYAQKCANFHKPPRATATPNHFAGSMQMTPALSMSDLRKGAFAMATALGPSLYIDPVLMHKLIRLIRVILAELNIDFNNGGFPTDPLQAALCYDILTLLDASILPALSYMDCNCCVSEEIWSVVKFFPYHYRYSLYGRWKNDMYLVHPKLIRRRGAAQKQIKALMKRVSKENVKPVGRFIGKLSHCSPGFLFDYILLQIQIYDNLIGPVVDSLKFLTSLSYDVLGYCLIEALAQADKNRFKLDGTSLSMWLQSSANFCGAIYKKYNIELSGLLQYVANQLKAHNSLDLLILKEVVQKMTGIEATEEMTNIDQLNAMSGGELLRAEAGYFSQVRNTKKSSLRLKDALASNNLAVTLCLLMAQQKHCVIYRETANNHLKLVGKLYDQCQDTLVQFGTFLGSVYSVDEYVERLPSIPTMLQEYHMHLDVAFFLARPMFTHQINQKYDQLVKAEGGKKLATAQKQEKYLEATAAIFAPIVQSVRPLRSPKVWEDISPQFLVTFWSLSMGDLVVPVESYQKEINQLKQQSLAVMESKDMNASKVRKEQERYMVLIDKLQDERKKQLEHVEKITRRLNQEKDSWFLTKSAKSAKNETITQFLQLCLFPRCTFTALDALYCSKFLHTIHTLKTANFATLLCYDRIFCDITYSVTSCTENEATRYGQFLCAMLETVMKWHENPATFNQECENYPGFVTKFRTTNQLTEANDLVGYENYRHVCHKWHYKITKAMVFCLDSKDYMQIRNALIILMRILPFFPMLVKLAQIVERKVEKVCEEERNQRKDLYLLATSYIGRLKARSNDMIREADFHQVADKPVKEAAAAPVAQPAATPVAVPAAVVVPAASADVKAVNGSGASSNQAIAESKDVMIVEKKSSSSSKLHKENSSNHSSTQQSSTTVDREPTPANSAKHSSSSNSKEHSRDNNGSIKESQNSASSQSTTQSTVKETSSKSSKDAKREEKQLMREKEALSAGNHKNDKSSVSVDLAEPSRKPRDREREKRRGERTTERKTVSPASANPYYDGAPTSGVDRYYSNDAYAAADRDRDRDLSSISNSSNGSASNRRSQESPDHDRELKRRKLEVKKIDEITMHPDDTLKKERNSKSKDKRKESSQYDDSDVRKEKRLGRKRSDLKVK